MTITARAIPEVWSDAALERARRVADPDADALAAKVLDAAHPLPADSRLGYNHLLDLADRLLEEPELYMVAGSQLRQELDRLDPALVHYFDPQLVPAWADEELLATAGRVWDAHSLAIIIVLYAASLPACYLMANGIPALYATRKLGEHRFILQRLYETGLMLDAAMRADGLRLVADAAPDQLTATLLAECQRRQPHAGWAATGARDRAARRATRAWTAARWRPACSARRRPRRRATPGARACSPAARCASCTRRCAIT